MLSKQNFCCCLIVRNFTSGTRADITFSEVFPLDALNSINVIRTMRFCNQWFNIFYGILIFTKIFRIRITIEGLKWF